MSIDLIHISLVSTVVSRYAYLLVILLLFIAAQHATTDYVVL
jgi:hypothetical protein